MAEDDRTVAESSASWNLQGGMGLHLRGRGLQLSPYEESGDSSHVSRGRSVFAGPKMNSRENSGCSQTPSLLPLRRRASVFVRMIHRYYAAVRLLADVHAGRVA